MLKKIINKAKKGDKKAFEELILYYQKDLYKIAKGHLFIEEDINDAIQETIISAYENIENLSDILKFKPWLIRILINECNMIHRKKKQENSISYDYFEMEKYIKQDYDMTNNLLDYTANLSDIEIIKRATLETIYGKWVLQYNLSEKNIKEAQFLLSLIFIYFYFINFTNYISKLLVSLFTGNTRIPDEYGAISYCWK